MVVAKGIPILNSLKSKSMLLYFGLVSLILLISEVSLAQVTVPNISMGLKSTDNPQEIVDSIKIVLMLTILTLAPAILILMTCFTRIIVIFSFLRQALGTQQMPPNQLLVGLSLFLTFFIMRPAFNEINSEALKPFLDGELKQERALEAGLLPLRKFMFKQTRPEDLRLFLNLARQESAQTRADVETMVLIPAFVISELKTAFQIGFIIYLPFLIIDMVIASVLMAMGMMMLPPVVISLPFKIMLFVIVDGWSLIVGSMVKSFG